MARFDYMKKIDDPFSFIPINDAGREIVKELVVVQNKSTFRYDLLYKKDLKPYN